MVEHARAQRRLLNYKDLKAIGISFSREHLRRLKREGKFARRIYLSEQKIAWFEDEVTEWLETRAAQRSTRVYRADD